MAMQKMAWMACFLFNEFKSFFKRFDAKWNLSNWSSSINLGLHD